MTNLYGIKPTIKDSVYSANMRVCLASKKNESMADVTKRIEKQVAELSPHLHMQCCSTKLGVDVEESTQERHQP